MIDFTHTKKSAIKGCKLTPADYKEVLNTLFKQANFGCNCHYIGDRLNLNLSNKYKHLENKWYIYALNSLDDNMIFILIKLYNDQNNEISLFNILNHFAIEENLNFFFNTTEKQHLFKDLVEDYNNNYSVLREKLIKRRNNWQVHISRIILDKKKFEEMVDLSSEECFKLLYYAFHTIRKLYKILFDEDLSLKNINHFSTFEEIDKFTSLLDNNGNLE